MTNGNKKQHEDLMVIEEAASFLRLSVGRLRYEVFLRRIPFFKMGRSVRFSREDLSNWLETKKKGAHHG